MPRQAREAPPPARERRTARTFFGRPWPLPISPTALGLLLAFLLAAGLAWAIEGRYTTTPAEAAKLLTPYKAEDVQQVTVQTKDGKATYTRDASGKFAAPGPQPTPSPTPGPDATPAPVVLSAATQMESYLNQLHDLKIDRTVEEKSTGSAEYGLDSPQFTVQITPKNGQPASIAVGRLNPNETSYYVRRMPKNDTVLVARYTIDDFVKVAGDLIKQTPS